MPRHKRNVYNGARGPNPSPHRRDIPDYPSLPVTEGTGQTPKAAKNSYSGTYVKGIATMHKSNAVPVTSGEAAKDLAKMRRN